MSSGRGESWSTHLSDLCLGVAGSHITEDQGLCVSWFGDFGGSSGDPLMSYVGGFLFINGEESGNKNKDGFAGVAASVPLSLLCFGLFEHTAAPRQPPLPRRHRMKLIRLFSSLNPTKIRYV